MNPAGYNIKGDGDLNLRLGFKEVNMELKNKEEKIKTWKAADLVIQALSSLQVKKTVAKEKENRKSSGNSSSFIIIY